MRRAGRGCSPDWFGTLAHPYTFRAPEAIGNDADRELQEFPGVLYAECSSARSSRYGRGPKASIRAGMLRR